MLAAAAGAMSPLLIGGAGLGIWKLLKRGGGDDSDDMDRASSSMSTARSQPPDYASRSGRFRLWSYVSDINTSRPENK